MKLSINLFNEHIKVKNMSSDGKGEISWVEGWSYGP